jgi:predicted SnoaL-like aldol condensation-catalyzing enzyme
MKFDPTDTSNRASLGKREVAERFIHLFYEEDNPEDAFTCWVHPDYIQHNPNAPTGRDATLAMMRASMERYPDLTHEVKRIVWGDDGAHVAVHFHFRRTKEERGHAIIDLLRFESGYLVEHWDVMQEVPEPGTTRNDNGMF